MSILPDPNTISYNKGWKDGYEEGFENNPYDGATQAPDHLQYRWGYDAGVACYCRDFLDNLSEKKETDWETKGELNANRI